LPVTRGSAVPQEGQNWAEVPVSAVQEGQVTASPG
jgi:hypothetical protein